MTDDGHDTCRDREAEMFEKAHDYMLQNNALRAEVAALRERDTALTAERNRLAFECGTRQSELREARELLSEHSTARHTREFLNDWSRRRDAFLRGDEARHDPLTEASKEAAKWPEWKRIAHGLPARDEGPRDDSWGGGPPPSWAHGYQDDGTCQDCAFAGKGEWVRHEYEFRSPDWYSAHKPPSPARDEARREEKPVDKSKWVCSCGSPVGCWHDNEPARDEARLTFKADGVYRGTERVNLARDEARPPLVLSKKTRRQIARERSPEPPMPARDEAPTEPGLCHLCGWSFSPEFLARHIKTHTEDK